MASTKDVLDHHIKCFGEGDLEGILSDYAPDAVLFTPDGPLKGVDAIRPFFQAMLAEFGKPGTAFSMKHRSIEGDYAYVLWTAETADNVYELGTDTTVVRDGKIVAQSYAGQNHAQGLRTLVGQQRFRPGQIHQSRQGGPLGLDRRSGRRILTSSGYRSSIACSAHSAARSNSPHMA